MLKQAKADLAVKVAKHIMQFAGSPINCTRQIEIATEELLSSPGRNNLKSVLFVFGDLFVAGLLKISLVFIVRIVQLPISEFKYCILCQEKQFWASVSSVLCGVYRLMVSMINCRIYRGETKYRAACF